MQRILVIGDSLGLPRFSKYTDEVELFYESTYPEVMRRHIIENGVPDVMLINLCRHAQCTHHLSRNYCSELSFSNPHAVVIQLGITDLWPSKGRGKMQAPSPELADKDPWVSASEYRANLAQFLTCCARFSTGAPPQLIMINIWPVSKVQYEKYPEVTDRIHLYNKILADVASHYNAALLDAYSLFNQLGNGALGSDGIHWSANASQLLGYTLGDIFLETYSGRRKGVNHA